MVANPGGLCYTSYMKEAKGKVLSRSLKSAGIAEGAVIDTIRKGPWQLEREQRIQEAPKKKRGPGEKKFRCLTEGEKKNMVRDKAGGMTVKAIAHKYGLAERYVERAVRERVCLYHYGQ